MFRLASGRYALLSPLSLSARGRIRYLTAAAVDAATRPMNDDYTAAGWRVKCPRGHTRLRRLRDGQYYCRSCERYYDSADLQR
ncbi:hypothetical protein SAMN04487945_1871 [Halobacterium jilantaiense]|uniref:Uncharacterized protein n=1 Tax=Halobacterium jilantaiense TaxID=355548 RepID=A0A1I0PQM6_9EURY|nr:hypothetical protein SAMN04487945_1871 [Halobacterium jilantaiense]